MSAQLKHSLGTLRLMAERLDVPLSHDFHTLVAVEKDGRSQFGFDTALRTRKALASDTLAPQWLRDYADEVVESVRPWINDGPDCYCCTPGCGERLVWGSCPRCDREPA